MKSLDAAAHCADLALKWQHVTTPTPCLADPEPGLLYTRLRRYADRRADGPGITDPEAYAIAARIAIDTLRRLNRITIDRHGRRIDRKSGEPMTPEQLARATPAPLFVVLDDVVKAAPAPGLDPAHACPDWLIPATFVAALDRDLPPADASLLRAVYIDGKMQCDVARERRLTESAITHQIRKALQRARFVLSRAFPEFAA